MPPKVKKHRQNGDIWSLYIDENFKVAMLKNEQNLWFFGKFLWVFADSLEFFEKLCSSSNLVKNFDQKSGYFWTDLGQMWLYLTKLASGAKSGDFGEFCWRFGQKWSGNTTYKFDGFQASKSPLLSMKKSKRIIYGVFIYKNRPPGHFTNFLKLKKFQYFFLSNGGHFVLKFEKSLMSFFTEKVGVLKFGKNQKCSKRTIFHDFGEFKWILRQIFVDGFEKKFKEIERSTKQNGRLLTEKNWFFYYLNRLLAMPWNPEIPRHVTASGTGTQPVVLAWGWGRPIQGRRPWIRRPNPRTWKRKVRISALRPRFSISKPRPSLPRRPQGSQRTPNPWPPKTDRHPGKRRGIQGSRLLPRSQDRPTGRSSGARGLLRPPWPGARPIRPLPVPPPTWLSTRFRESRKESKVSRTTRPSPTRSVDQLILNLEFGGYI